MMIQEFLYLLRPLAGGMLGRVAKLPQARRHEVGEDKGEDKVRVENNVEQIRRHRPLQPMIVHGFSLTLQLRMI
jgi:hypothetical protein